MWISPFWWAICKVKRIIYKPIYHANACISSVPKGAVYHQTKADFIHGNAVMICKGQALDDMPNLANASVWIKNSLKRVRFRLFLVERDGFEPSKSVTTDLQSAPFGHSGISPCGAGDRNRTNNLLITNQLLCQLSYTSRAGALGRS